MLVISKVQSHLLNDYPTKAMTNENQWAIFSVSLLLLLRLMRVIMDWSDCHLFTLIVQSREQLNST